MREPAVTIVQGWPGALSLKSAASYLEVSDAQFRRILAENPWIRPFNLIENGDVRFDLEDLEKFRAQRKAAGIERAG